MTCPVCPNCGTDLERFEPLERGDLSLTAHQIRWKGKRVELTPASKIIVSAVARANGVPLSLVALGEAAGTKEDAVDIKEIVRIHVFRARQAFRQIDPAFDALETVRGFGLRWAA